MNVSGSRARDSQEDRGKGMKRDKAAGSEMAFLETAQTWFSHVSA
jgi:hypothetical protein